MAIISWLILGLVAGALAKWIMPGDDPGGIWVTILIGIVGSFVGGFIGSLVGLGTSGGLNVASILSAAGGALLLLFVYRKIKT